MDSASGYKLQLAFAALVGAAAAAAAGYYLHCRTVAQVGGDLARSASSRRRRTRAPAPAGAPPRRAGASSASLPDLSAFYEGGRVGPAAGGYLVEEDEEDDADGGVGPHGSCALDADALLQIPQGLPRLHLGPNGTFTPIWNTCGYYTAVWVGATGLEWIGLGDLVW